jgi:hypothetical protein
MAKEKKREVLSHVLDAYVGINLAAGEGIDMERALLESYLGSENAAWIAGNAAALYLDEAVEHLREALAVMKGR